MASEISDSPESIEVRREVDACCQAFENAWKNGHSPAMEHFVAGVRPSGRTQIIRELLLLELNYRRNVDGAPLTELQICELHPELMPEIAEQAHLMQGRRSNDPGGEAMTQLLASSEAKNENTIEHKSNKAQRSQASGSRGLHIRCPHCSNAVELLTDTAFESITCQTCGSCFSLVDENEQTRGFADESFAEKPFEMLNRVSGESEFMLEGVDDALESIYDEVIIVDGKDRGDFILVDPQFKKVTSIRRTTFAALDFAFAPQQICITESGGLISCYDVNSGQQQWAYNPGNGIHALKLAYKESHQRFAAITWPYKSGGDRQLITLSPDDGEVVTLATISDAVEFAFCCMGSILISSSGQLRDSATGEVVGALDFFPTTEEAG